MRQIKGRFLLNVMISVFFMCDSRKQFGNRERLVYYICTLLVLLCYVVHCEVNTIRGFAHSFSELAEWCASNFNYCFSIGRIYFRGTFFFFPSVTIITGNNVDELQTIIFAVQTKMSAFAIFNGPLWTGWWERFIRTDYQLINCMEFWGNSSQLYSRRFFITTWIIQR